METAQTLWAAFHHQMSATAPEGPGAPLLDSPHVSNVVLTLWGAKLGTVF